MKLTKKERIRNAVCAAVSILAFLTIWQLATMFSHLGELIPSPIEVVQYLFTVDKIGRRTFLQHSLVSLSRVLIAYSAACVVGITLGLLMGWYPKVKAIFMPLFNIIRPIPPIAWTSLAILWFGLGEMPKWFIIFIAAFCNVVINAFDGAQRGHHAGGLRQNAGRPGQPDLHQDRAACLGPVYFRRYADRPVQQLGRRGGRGNDSRQRGPGLGHRHRHVRQQHEADLCRYRDHRHHRPASVDHYENAGREASEMEQIRDLKPVIECRGISKEFTNERGTTRVVDHFDLEVSENEFVVLFGPGQCGKTTLLNLLSGLELPTTGEAVINGRTVTGPDPERGFVYQTTALFPWLTVMGNVSFGPRVQGVKKEEWHRRAEKYIRLVGLEGFEKSFPNQLSGGMRQRVGIARAYCNEPKVLFLDEPFGHLDAQTRYLMQEEIMRIWDQEKRTVLFVTNNIEEAIYLADRIIVLSNCPTHIKAEYVIDLPRPRNLVDPEFLRLRSEITDLLDKNME